MIGLVGASAPMVAWAREAQRGEADGQTVSPLHDFLGIDPETGEFVDPEPPADGGGPEEPASGSDTPSGRSSSSRAATGSPRGAAGDLPRTAEEANEAVRRMTERLQAGSLEELSSLAGERFTGSRLHRLSRTLAWVIGGLLLLYPLSMVISESLGWWLRRQDSGLTEMDRRYERTRLRRRLMLAAVWIGLILLGTLGSVNAYWWDQPELFTLFCVAIALLGLAAASLASMIKQSAKRYSLTLIHQMRREQLEIRADLDELCKRMRQVTMNQ